MKRSAQDLELPDDHPSKKRFCITLESYKEQKVIEINEKGEELKENDPTPEQKFSELLSRLRFDQQEEPETQPEKKETTKQTIQKNPVDLFNNAAGELHQLITLIDFLSQNKVERIKLPTQHEEESKETIKLKRVTKSYTVHKRKIKALTDATQRLQQYASYLEIRNEKRRQRLEEMISLKEKWKVNHPKLKMQRTEYFKECCSIDYSFKSIGAQKVHENANILQTLQSTHLQMPPRAINRSITFIFESDTPTETTQYHPCDTESLSISATGTEEIDKLLENAQRSSLYADLFSSLSNDSTLVDKRNIVRKERSVEFKPTFSHTLTIQFSSLPQNKHTSLTTQQNGYQSKDIHHDVTTKSNYHFDLSVINIILLKLMHLKYRQDFALQNYNVFYAPSSKPSLDKPNELNVLSCTYRFFAHITFKKQVINMLDNLAISFSTDKHSLSFNRRSVETRWINTRHPLISSVDVLMGERTLFTQTSITIRENEATLEGDCSRVFSDVAELKEVLCLLFCSHILSSLQKEALLHKKVANLTSNSLQFPNLYERCSYLEIVIELDDLVHPLSSVKETVLMLSPDSAIPHRLPLSEVPGFSYHAKLLYMLYAPSTEWFYRLLHNQSS